MSEVITWVVMLGPLALGLVWGMRIHNQLIRRRNFVDDAWSGIEVQLKRRQNLIPALWKSVHGDDRAGAEPALPSLDRGLSPAQAILAIQQQDAILADIEDDPAASAGGSMEARQTLRDTLAGIESDIEHARRYFNGTAREYNTLVESFPASLVAGLFHFPRVAYFETGHAPGAMGD